MSNAKDGIQTSKQKTHTIPEDDQERFYETVGSLGCQYHERLFENVLNEVKGKNKTLSPIERYLQEDALQGHLLSLRQGKKEASGRKGCTCKTFREDLVISDEEKD